MRSIDRLSRMTTTPRGGNVVVLDGAGGDNNDGLRRQVAHSRAELAQASNDGHRLVQHRIPARDTVRHSGSHRGTAPTRSGHDAETTIVTWEMSGVYDQNLCDSRSTESGSAWERRPELNVVVSCC